MNRNDAAPTAAPTSVGTIAPARSARPPEGAQTPMTPNSPTTTSPTTQAVAQRDDADHDGVDGEEHADADQQRRLVVRAERVDRRTP